MKFSFFDKKPKKVSEEEKKIVRTASAEADPTTYTTLAPGELVEVGRTEELYDYPILQDKYGTRYVDMTEKFAKPGATEQVVAGLLKGILNVSDVVRVTNEQGTKYYSKIVELDKTSNTTLQEMNADVALLETIFNDPDRVIAFGDQEDHNMARDEKRMKVAYFDFGGIKSHFWREGYVNRKRAIGALDPVGLSYLEEKLTALEERLAGEEGKAFLRSLIERSGQTARQLFVDIPAGFKSEDLLTHFQTELLNRIAEMLMYVEERKNVRKVA